MYLPQFDRILKEDLGKDAPGYTDKLIYQLNTMVDYLKVAFAGNIDLTNTRFPVKQLQITARATPADNALSFLVSLPSGYQPSGLIVLNCTDLSGSVVGDAVWAELQPGLQDKNVVVRAIYGLTDGHQYSITFLVI